MYGQNFSVSTNFALRDCVLLHTLPTSVSSLMTMYQESSSNYNSLCVKWHFVK